MQWHSSRDVMHLLDSWFHLISVFKSYSSTHSSRVAVVVTQSRLAPSFCPSIIPVDSLCTLPYPQPLLYSWFRTSLSSTMVWPHPIIPVSNPGVVSSSRLFSQGNITHHSYFSIEYCLLARPLHKLPAQVLGCASHGDVLHADACTCKYTNTTHIPPCKETVWFCGEVQHSAAKDNISSRATWQHDSRQHGPKERRWL